MYEALMKVDIIREYIISASEILDFTIDAEMPFMKKWKGSACENFKKHWEHESLILHSIVHFTQNKLTKGPPTSTPLHRIFKYHVDFDVLQNYACGNHEVGP
jgi:hypothetical protein